MRLNQVTMPMLDYAESVAFYTALGLRLIVASPPHYARFECPDADGGEPATLSVEKVEAWSGGAWPEVFLEVEDLDATLARLRGGPHGRRSDQPELALARSGVMRSCGRSLKTLYGWREPPLPPLAQPFLGVQSLVCSHSNSSVRRAGVCLRARSTRMSASVTCLSAERQACSAA